MAKILIDTDLTNCGTTVTVDGVALTKMCNFSFDASAPCEWSPDGSFTINYCENIDGNMKFTALRNGERNVDKCIGENDEYKEMALKISDFIGTKPVTNEITLVDSIVEHCEKNKIVCPSRDVLAKRSETSLKDKAIDLGIDIS